MRTGRSEALDLFRKWMDERALVRCDFSFIRFACAFRGSILSVTDDAIRLMSDDRKSELFLKIGPDVTFAYGDPRSKAWEGGEGAQCALVLLVPASIPGERSELIFFLELIT